MYQIDFQYKLYRKVLRPMECRGGDPRVERSRAAVIAAGRDLLDEGGWDAVTHVAVAERSGVGRTTVYRHWPDSISLLRDVVMSEHRNSHATPTGELRQDLVAELDQFRLELQRPGFVRLMLTVMERAAVDPEFARLRKMVHDEGSCVLRSILRTGVRNGDLPLDLEIDRAVDELCGALVFRRLVSGRPLSAAFVRWIVDDFLAGRPAAATPSVEGARS